MDLKLLWNTLFFCMEMSVNMLVLSGMQTLFVKCRWDRKKSILRLWLVGFIPMSYVALSHITADYVTGRLLGTTSIYLILIFWITKDRIGKVLLSFMVLYICVIFSEAFVSVILFLFMESAGEIFIPYLKYPGILDKLRHYEYRQSMLAFLTMGLTCVFMTSIYLVMKRKNLNLNRVTLIPFLIPGVLQMFLGYLCIYLIGFYYVSIEVEIMMLGAQTMALLGMLWLLWQTGISGKRTMIERELAKFRLRGDSDARQYDRLREVKMELGRFRHDFNNQMQMINCLLEQNTEEGVRKAERMIEDLLLKTEKMG